MMLKLNLYSESHFRKPSVLLVIFLISLSGCVNTYEPVKRLEDQQNERKKNIEEILSKRHGSTAYQSLAFGPLTIYKPESFQQLDSLYALKDDYIERNDIRGLKNSGVEEKIPAYRAEAQNEIDKVKYEIEHIYQVDKNDSLIVSHTFFTFNHKDSLLSEDKLYDYTIPEKYKKMHANYLFEYHFITNRDMYISSDERDFIRYYKRIEQQLDGSDKIDSFMIHTLETMELAQKINSVDYRELIKYKSIENLKSLGGNITINEFGTLIALKDNDNQIFGYEYTIRWEDNANKIKKKSIFRYSPTLIHEETTTMKE
tara:strand:- start:65703 stop:66644 length:942 start_codon:yes stop_codon:yes gene_type:complete